MMPESKWCPGCEREKPAGDFYRDRSRSHGLTVRCKACISEATRRYSRENPEKRRELVRLWAERNRDYKRARNAARDHERYRDARVARDKAHPEKVIARNKVNNEVSAGRLVRPDCCERCGSNERQIQAHHEDYSAPLDVIWLCSSCHGAAHRIGAA